MRLAEAVKVLCGKKISIRRCMRFVRVGNDLRFHESKLAGFASLFSKPLKEKAKMAGMGRLANTLEKPLRLEDGIP